MLTGDPSTPTLLRRESILKEWVDHDTPRPGNRSVRPARHGTKMQSACFPRQVTKEIYMPAILLWLMGVPLIVILLLYLIF